ncbi:MAG: phosphatidate cytidylyltransferase, partial [Bacteroidota bacterium]
MSNFWARTITGLSMVFILLAGLYFNQMIFAGLFFVIAILGLNEFYTLVSHENAHPQKVFGILSGIILYVGIISIQYLPGLFNRMGFSLLPFFIPIPIFFLSFVIEVYRNKPNPLTNISLTILGIFYIVLPLALLNILNSREVAHFLGFPAFLTGYFIFVWSNDTTAYLFGKQFGKHKFFERISPKKTWEGTLAGSTVAILLAIGLSFLVAEITIFDWLVLVMIVVMFVTIGD